MSTINEDLIEEMWKTMIGVGIGRDANIEPEELSESGSSCIVQLHCGSRRRGRHLQSKRRRRHCMK